VSVPTRHLGWSIVKNIGGQSAGKLALTVARFVIAAIIVKVAGKESFGEYALVLSFLLIGEWLADFGLTDICVRAICQDPGSESEHLGALGLAKLVQGLGACVVIALAVVAIGYPTRILEAVGVGSIGMLCYAAAQVYRAGFKVRMQMERDVAAELLGVLVMVPLTYAACVRGLGLPWLIGCHAVSRFVFLMSLALFSKVRARHLWSLRASAEARAAFLVAAPLGISGLCAAVYDQLDPILLHRLSGPGEVAHYSGAMRFVWPVTVIVQAICGSVFPVLSASWQKDSARFRLVFQRCMDLSVFVAAGAVATVYCGSEALVGLFGKEMAESAEVLRILVLAIFARAINNALVVSFIVAGGVKFAFFVSVASLVAKFIVLIIVIPRHGSIGAAYGDVACEWLTGVLPVLLITQRLIRYRVQWTILLKTGVAIAAAVALTEVLGLRGGWVGMGVGMLVFPAVAMMLRAIDPRELKMLKGSVKGRFATRSEEAS
jgi:O-antigen/teichoic acid export membrane protein